MHTDTTPKCIENAMPSLTRRAVLAGTVATIGMPAAAVAAPIEDSPLFWLIDAHNEVRSAITALESEIQAVKSRADYPGLPTVTLTDLDAGMYAVNWRRKEFFSLEEIDNFFTSFPDAVWFNEEGAVRHFDNHETARLLFLRREADYKAWRSVTGLQDMADREDILLDEDMDLDDRIVSYLCETFAEVTAKVRWFEQEYGDEISQEHALRILRSMSGFSSTPNGVSRAKTWRDDGPILGDEVTRTTAYADWEASKRSAG